ncbi:uncharacterized protein LOC130625857 [Hydractinia symbiolongicarpus]|uniref:uncharacterized protein LOC130625857 n=1 Tax=Hydractinia symbiolongicarpus TaxID=13093 RepID=UPI002550378D|nr:uncharacterized protein LOC130625857 [Hydractinia symbiolongicarpus]
MVHKSFLHTLWILLVGLIVIEAVKLSNNNVEKKTFCELSASKRMLHSLGINSLASSCLLKSKRDIAHLVSSYLERELFPEKRDLVDELEDYIKKEMFHKRGSYCCSPRCDKFMMRMGTPNAALVQCNNG